MNRDESLESSPLFVLGLLKTALESRDTDLPHLDDVLNVLLQETQVDPGEFHSFLEKYREALRSRCRLKGYV